MSTTFSACACTGPPGDCPCLRRARGEAVESGWTEEKQLELRAALSKIFEGLDDKPDYQEEK